MTDQPNTQPDDAEGHGLRKGGLDTEAVTEEDTEGHGMRRNGLDSEAVTEDDVEGHVNFISPDGPEDQA